MAEPPASPQCHSPPPSPPRRTFLAGFTTLVAGALAFPRLLRAKTSHNNPIDAKTLKGAEQISGLELTDPERELMLEGLNETRASYERLRKVELRNDVPPALRFVPSDVANTDKDAPCRYSRPSVDAAPSNLEELAYLPLASLSELVRTKRVTSLALTEMYLDRLTRLDSKLHCVITLTGERAIAQAKRADQLLANGQWLGPLHGIPWGAKDLLSARGYRTTWGAKPFENQVIDEDATVIERLDAAGAVLIAKLTLGALAWGDVWFGEKTRNPWNLEQGSSGSSAGSAAATAAGCVGFAIGTETWGSIVSPATRCGDTGLRPTFGRVSRHGAMALAWSMDKVGPICRAVEDCAMVLDAIHGADGRDPSAVTRRFTWDHRSDPTTLRLGYVPTLFNEEPKEPEAQEWRALDREALAKLRSIGFEPRPIELPALPIDDLAFILSAEAAAAFDELTRSGRDDELVRQIKDAWPNVFRQARMIPAVEYIQANRVRTLVMREMDRIMAEVDVFVAPTFGGNHLLMTNLTGHPCVVLPNGFRKDGTPTSITFTGRLYGEADLMAIARAYQD